MRLPGAAFLREQSAVRAFERLPRSHRRLVFYSEGGGDWPHIGPVIEELLRSSDVHIAYLTSDPANPGLSIEDDRLRAFHVGSGTARTILFARIECDRFVMTLPDLGNLWLKRSVHPVEYVYLFHSMNSTHTSYRTGAFDNFDTILCVGPHHVEEIRQTEEVYGLPAKQLVEHGSAKLDTVLDEVRGARGSRPLSAAGGATVLLAPTWGDSSFIEGPLGERVVDAVLEAGHRAVLRLHPMTTRRMPERIASLEQRYGNHEAFRLERDMSAIESWLQADVMISDWSGAATEYAFALGRPVVYIGTPAKIMNPHWGLLGLPAFEDRIRVDLGRVVAADEVASLPQALRSALADSATASNAAAARDRSVFNVGSSSAAAASFLAAQETRH